MRTIPFFRVSTPLSPSERLAKRRIILQDTLSLFSIFLVTVLIGVLTWLIFRSYSQHQQDAATRWRRRGVEALQQNNAKAAVYDLQTSLGYGSEDRATEVMLAQALYQLNTPRSLEEAAVYLNALWEKEPGNGEINLQLARVLARQGAVRSALDHYHAAVYGVWQGNGTVQGREARLEMVRYEIGLGRYNDARGELLIAASNDTSAAALMEVAGLLSEAHWPTDALHIYAQLAKRRPVIPQALEGAGQMAFTLSRYRTARDYLQKAVDAASVAHPLADLELAQQNLKTASAVMAAFPSPSLPNRERQARVVAAVKTAQQRYAGCAAAGAQPQATLKGNSKVENDQALVALGGRWQAMPQPLTARTLVSDADLEQTAMQLVYDTEEVTARVCGQPTGADAALLLMAGSPETVDQ